MVFEKSMTRGVVAVHPVVWRDLDLLMVITAGLLFEPARVVIRASRTVPNTA